MNLLRSRVGGRKPKSGFLPLMIEGIDSMESFNSLWKEDKEEDGVETSSKLVVQRVIDEAFGDLEEISLLASSEEDGRKQVAMLLEEGLDLAQT